MLKFLAKNLSRFFLVFILAACVWFLIHRSSHRPDNSAGIKDAALSLWLPVQRSITWLITFPENTLNAIQQLRTLRGEVNRLQMENQSLQLELSNHRSLETELAHLQNVLKIRSRFPHKARIARIIAHDPSTWNSSFIIDAGSDDGVLVDSPVVSEQGVVGRVLETTRQNSRVLMLTDKESSISAIDQRSGVTGVVLGTGGNHLSFGYVSANEDVKKDDVLVSAGLGGVFPKGYMIGTVAQRKVSENGLTADIEVVPAVDFAALDYIFVLPPIDIYQ